VGSRRIKLVVNGVSRAFRSTAGDVLALDNISLEVADGEFLMVVGQSGCGKSTLLSIIAGLDSCDSGEVKLDGNLIEGPGPDRSLVFQDGALFPWLTVLQNVEFGLLERGMSRSASRERARGQLQKVGLEKFESHSVHQLSGGMRQRVAIARSLVLDPEILLMDEPFSALDALTREDLYTELQNLWLSQGTTVVFVTHNVREAVTLGDRIVVLAPRPGRIRREFKIGLPRPRTIDDLQVAEIAHEVTQWVRGEPKEVEGGAADSEEHPDDRVFHSVHSDLGSRV
jgi:NitT/TauT family transport system ATP-binding protein